MYLATFQPPPFLPGPRSGPVGHPRRHLESVRVPVLPLGSSKGALPWYPLRKGSQGSKRLGFTTLDPDIPWGNVFDTNQGTRAWAYLEQGTLNKGLGFGRALLWP